MHPNLVPALSRPALSAYMAELLQDFYWENKALYAHEVSHDVFINQDKKS